MIVVIRPTKNNWKTPNGMQFMMVRSEPIILMHPSMDFELCKSLDDYGEMEVVPREEWLFRSDLVGAIEKGEWDWRIDEYLKYNHPEFVNTKPKTAPAPEAPKEKPKGRPKGWKPGMSYSELRAKQ